MVNKGYTIDNIVFFPVVLKIFGHLPCNMASYPPSIHSLFPIQLNYLLPACMHSLFYLDFSVLLFSCSLCPSGDGGTRHEEVPAKDSRAPFDHQETGGQKCSAGG